MKKLFLQLAILSIIYSVSCNVFSQNFLWNKSHGDSLIDQLSTIASSFKGNSSYLVTTAVASARPTKVKTKYNDSLFVSDTNTGSWIIKMDLDGSALFVKKFPNTSPNLINVVDDSAGNIYVLINVTLPYNGDSVQLFPKAPYLRSRHLGHSSSIVLAKLDSNFSFLQQVEMPSLVLFQGAENIQLIGKELYFGFFKNGFGNATILNGNTYLKGVYMNSINTDLNITSLKSLKFSSFPDNFPTTRLGGFERFDNGIKMVYAGRLPDSIGAVSTGIISSKEALYSIQFKDANFTNPQLVILTDTNYNSKFNRPAFHRFSQTKYAILANVSDTIIKLKNTTISKPGTYGPVAMFFDHDTLEYSSLLSSDSLDNYAGRFTCSGASDKYLYAGGVLYGSNTFFGRKFSNKDGTAFFCKIDQQGNILWFFRTGDTTYSPDPKGVSIDSSKNIYTGYTYTTSTSIGGKIFQAVDSSIDYLISKIADFTIIRGEVASGPYCAGDTFLIPYKKFKNFLDSNVFIAELSDEYGKFTGGHRELGRLKTNKDSTIKGILPLFDVVTSTDYRIRVVSTKPQVQSNYKLDTLSLLIYSKDTAYIGADTTICRGGNINLTSSGGSSWQWSPGTLFEDSSGRIVELRTGLFQQEDIRVIISDSSGCGDTDTAYISLEPFDKIDILNKDTLLCINTFIEAQSVGGQPNSLVYSWQDSAKNTVLSDSSMLLVDWRSQRVILLIVSDSCDLDRDSSYLKISTFDSIVIHNTPDTLICSGVPFTISSEVSGGNGTYTYNWEGESIQTISTYDILKRSDSLIKLTVHGHCPNELDFIDLRYVLTEKSTPHPLIPDSLLCFGERIVIHPKPLSGLMVGAPIWNVDGTIISSDSLLITALKMSSISYSVVNECNDIFRDTFIIDVRDSLSISGPKDTLICRNTDVRITYTAKGGKNPSLKIYSELFQLLDSSTSHLFNEAVDYSKQDSIFIVAEDNCSQVRDTFITRFSRAPQSLLKINGPSDTLICQNTAATIPYYVKRVMEPKIMVYDATFQLLDSSNNGLFNKALDYSGQDSIFIVAEDECYQIKDSLVTHLDRFDSLNAQIIVSPTCYTDSVYAILEVKGGKVPRTNIFYQWELDGNVQGSSDKLELRGLNLTTQTLTVLVSDNCSYPVKNSFIIKPNPIVSMTVNDASQCFHNQYFIFKNTTLFNPVDTPKFKWRIPVEFLADSNIWAYLSGKFNSIGLRELSLLSENSNGCIDSFSIQTETRESESSTIVYKKKTNFSSSSSNWEFLLIGQSMGPVRWEIDGSIYSNKKRVTHTFRDTGTKTINVRYVDKYGCLIDTTFNIYVVHIYFLNIQNGISVNNDGLNDFFELVGKEYVKSISTQIFNRWGEMVFKSNDINFKWQPKFKGTTKYIYLIKATDIYGFEHDLKGNLTVLR